MNRNALATMSISGLALVGILVAEGYKDKAYVPVAGDVPTIGFGTTEGVKPGQTITVPTALQRALKDVQKFEGALKACVTVPLHQHEYDAYISLSYNIGSGAFCRSTLVKKLNAQDYAGACLEILKWDRFKGERLRGLTLRREKEYVMCRGG